MQGIPSNLYSRLRRILLQCELFDSNNRLRTLFDDKRLIPWSNQVPEAQSRAERVEAVIHFLIGKRLSGTQEIALVLLLEVLQDRTDPGDASYQQFIDLMKDLREISPNHMSSAIPMNKPLQNLLGGKPTRTSTFISYSYKDKQYLQELQVHLKHYMRQDNIKVWDDTKILPGSRRHDELKHALQSTKVAVLLVSADFFASDFITNRELSPLLEIAEQEEVTFLSVILRPCAFDHSELAQFQAVNSPSQPLALMEPAKRDTVWSSLAERIWKILTDQHS